MKFETKLERHLARLSLALCVLAAGVGVLAYSLYRNAKNSQLLADEQLPFRAYDKSAVTPRAVKARFRPNELIIEFDPSASAADRERVFRMAGALSRQALHTVTPGSSLSYGDHAGEIDLATLKPQSRDLPSSQVQTALRVGTTAGTNPTQTDELADSISLGSVIARVQSDRSVKAVQPNYLYSLTNEPNDELYQKGLSWNMYSSGPQGPMNSQYGTQASAAWSKGIVGSYEVYVAIIDSGVDASHPDLAPNVDTAHAVDYARSPNNPADAPYVNKDEIGHGTHVAGIVGAVGNNGIGVAGVAWKIKLVPVKVVSAGANELIDDATAIKAFEYITQLRQQGVNIVAANVSWGSYGIADNKGRFYPDYALLRSIKQAARAGILCVASAGNDNNDNDQRPMYPASFDTTDSRDGTDALPYNAVISVAALNPDGSMWPYSNHGKMSVQIGAPGSAILSPIPTGSQFARSGAAILRSPDGSLYATESGTSAAAPHVTGAIALFFGSHANATPLEAHDKVLNSRTPTPSLVGNTSSGGRLDLSQL